MDLVVIGTETVSWSAISQLQLTGEFINNGFYGLGFSPQYPGSDQNSYILSPGAHHLFGAAGLTSQTAPASGNLAYSYDVTFSNVTFAPGWSQSHPLLPDHTEGNSFGFQQAPNHAWIDPPTATGYDYQMTDSSLFTKIMSFPTGFTGPFEVLADGFSLGNFTDTDSVDFVSLLGHGVSSFHIRGITPAVDGTDASAFPVLLEFDNPTASLTITAVDAASLVPEIDPAGMGSVLALVTGTLGLLERRRLKAA